MPSGLFKRVGGFSYQGPTGDDEPMEQPSEDQVRDVEPLCQPRGNQELPSTGLFFYTENASGNQRYAINNFTDRLRWLGGAQDAESFTFQERQPYSPECPSCNVLREEVKVLRE